MIKKVVARMLQRIFNVALGPELGRLNVSQSAEARALFTLSGIAPSGFVPWPRPSLSPATLAAILNDIVINSRATIVELGSGPSTVFLARLLKDTGGNLLSIEQDEQWARVVQEMVRREGIEDRVKIVVAPLVDHPTKNSDRRWYDESVFSQHLPESKIDLLIVDGPSSDKEVPLIRYPAAGYFSSFMEEKHAIVLDDILRADEKRIAAAWVAELGYSFHSVGDAGFFFRGPHYKPKM